MKRRQEDAVLAPDSPVTRLGVPKRRLNGVKATAEQLARGSVALQFSRAAIAFTLLSGILHIQGLPDWYRETDFYRTCWEMAPALYNIQDDLDGFLMSAAAKRTLLRIIETVTAKQETYPDTEAGAISCWQMLMACAELLWIDMRASGRVWYDRLPAWEECFQIIFNKVMPDIDKRAPKDSEDGANLYSEIYELFWACNKEKRNY